MSKLIVCVLACAAMVVPARALAQVNGRPGVVDQASGRGPLLSLDQFDALASRAKEAVNVSLDQSMMQMASAFVSGAAKNNGASGKNIADIVSGLKGVYVRNFSFDNEGAYSAKDIDGVRAQLKAPWTSIVSTREEHETVDVYTWPENGQVGGLAVVVAEPKEVTIVNIVGRIDMAQLASLAGSFGIPKTLGIPLPGDAKGQKKEE